MHPEATQFVIEAIQTYGPFQRVLEVGSRDVNGTIRDHFIDHGTQYYMGADLVEGPNVDVVADFSQWDNRWQFMPPAPNFPPSQLSTTDTVYVTGYPYVGKYNAIVCVNTLEHTPQGPGIFKMACHMLGPDGIFIMSAANDWMPHGSFDGGLVLPGEHYANVTVEECQRWAEEAGFSGWKVGIRMHDVQCLAWR